MCELLFYYRAGCPERRSEEVVRALKGKRSLPAGGLRKVSEAGPCKVGWAWPCAYEEMRKEQPQDEGCRGRGQGNALRKQEAPRPGMKARWVVKTIRRHG